MSENNNLKNIFARNLKIRRKRHHLTQAELAKKIGISTSFITEIENGRKSPSFSTIEKLSKVLEAPSWSFFCEYGDKISLEEEKIAKLSLELKNEISSTIDEFIKNRF
ncbi:MAG: helix-turn-helix transcriptional regulator [Sphaerochaetaceae bacterium]|nr:helix-turn-helix transcriptional regulator [Sphaerochaetaceae bacterium]MDC7236441.1 helix-turn-helix transcriptional regulator [Sphaerochaetaceae bacterium]